MSKNIQSCTSKDDWHFVTKSYLALAYVGIQELLNKNYLNKKPAKK